MAINASAFLTVEQVAERTGLSASAIYRAIKDGRLPAFVADGWRKMVLESDLATYVDRDNHPGWLTLKEACGLLDLSPARLTQLAREGKIRRENSLYLAEDVWAYQPNYSKRAKTSRWHK